MRLMNSTAVWLSLSVFALSGCGRVAILNHEVCGDKGTLGASCFHMLSDASRSLTKEEWDAERFGQLCMQANAFANLKAALLVLCQKTKRCTFEEIQQIKALSVRVQDFKKEVSHGERGF